MSVVRINVLDIVLIICYSISVKRHFGKHQNKLPVRTELISQENHGRCQNTVYTDNFFRNGKNI